MYCYFLGCHEFMIHQTVRYEKYILTWNFKEKVISEKYILAWNFKEKVFMTQPPSFVDPDHPTYVYKLQKSLYDFKQALHAWFDKFSVFFFA